MATPMRQAFGRAQDVVIDEVRGVVRGFVEHGYPGKLYMLLMGAVATVLMSASLSFLVAALLLADHPVFVAVLGAWVGMLACGFWSMLRSFAHFTRLARFQALATVAPYPIIFAFGWVFAGRSVWLGLAGMSWLALNVQFVVYLARTGEMWKE